MGARLLLLLQQHRCRLPQKQQRLRFWVGWLRTGSLRWKQAAMPLFCIMQAVYSCTKLGCTEIVCECRSLCNGQSQT
jgi:hypothetical protein